MGIENIHFLINTDTRPDPVLQIQAAREQTLVNAHRHGEHPWGNMRRECPLCQLGK